MANTIGKIMNINFKQLIYLSKKLTLLVIVLFTIFSSLYSPALLAANNDGLLEAIEKNKIEDVKELLQNGADPNDEAIFSLIEENADQDPKIVELLFNNNYKKLDPSLYCQHEINKLLAMRNMELTNIFDILPSPSKVSEVKYKNLNAKAAAYPKIPRILHHVWVTNEETKKEIPKEDIQHVLDTDKIFSQSKQRWEHIVWTNDKSLIPNSVKELESKGVQVRELTEIKKYFRLGR